YNLLIQVNGTNVIVNAGSKSFSFLYGPRVVEGENQGLNKGLLGFGSDQSRGTLDNIKIQVVPPQITLDTTEDFNDGVANLFTGTTTGTWAPSTSDGRYTGTPATGSTVATKGIDLGAQIQPESYVEYTAQVKTAATAGLVFDQYAANDYKYVVLDIAGQKVLLGHQDPTRGFVVDQTITRTLSASTDYTLSLSLKASSVAVTLNGAYITTFAYNAPVVDGSLGLISKGGTGSFDNVHVRTNDPGFNVAANTVSVSGTGTTSPNATETQIATQFAIAKSQISAQYGVLLSALGNIRIAIADLPGLEQSIYAGRTIYIDRDGGGRGWTDETLLAVIKQQLGRMLGVSP
ncbi:MAG: hypothetical protein ABJB39_09370, partial [Chloroflexota bacterium]